MARNVEPIYVRMDARKKAILAIGAEHDNRSLSNFCECILSQAADTLEKSLQKPLPDDRQESLFAKSAS